MSSEVLQLATLIYTSHHSMLIMPPSATWSCILKHLFVCLFVFPDYAGFSAFNNAFNFLLSQQQSCLLISHVIEALILDSQAAR